jgi:hypothetical protein
LHGRPEINLCRRRKERAESDEVGFVHERAVRGVESANAIEECRFGFQLVILTLNNYANECLVGGM